MGSCEKTHGVAPHRPVLLSESLVLLNINPHGDYLDATLGAGGHAEGIASNLADGRLLGLDRDESALAIAGKRLATFGKRVMTAHAPFSHAIQALDDCGIEGLDGVLADLGASSMQFDDPERGFSFSSPFPIDLRMDRTTGVSAADLLRRVSERELTRILREYGEERYAPSIARRLIRGSEADEALTGLNIRRMILEAVPARYRRESGIDPATRTFQALRIAVNDELGELATFLDLVIERCRPGARIVVISFHSLEDRIVKRRFASWANPCECPKGLPICVCGKKPRVRIVTKKAVRPGGDESEANPRSRSARMRAAEVISDGLRKEVRDE